MKKAIIFDLDGTLWDSSKQVVDSWNMVLLRYPELNRQITIEDMHGYMGKTMNDIAEIMLPDISPEESHRIIKECGDFENEYLETNHGILYPMLEETLAKLCKGHSLYIVSNCQDGYIQVFLRTHKLEQYFSDFECSGRTGNPKCDNIRSIILRNNADTAIYVGDTQLDYESSYKAGVPFIHAAYGFGKINCKVPTLDSFSELPKLITAIYPGR